MFLKVLLILSFTTSLVIGEDLCCSDLFSGDEVGSVINIDGNKNLESEILGTHFCDPSKESGQDHDENCHLCIGCSHSPFIGLNDQFKGASLDIGPTRPLIASDLISNPFLEGLFRPPKA